jgi:hypothetical protein
MKWYSLVIFVLLVLYTLTINAQNSLVAYWSFDELANDIIYDYSQNTNHATNYGATLVPGIIGNALSFDGTDDFVRISKDGKGPPTIFSTLGKGSISVWFKAENIPTNYGIAPILYYGTEQQCDFFDAANKGLIIELGHSPVYLGSEAIFFTIWKNGCTYPSFCFDSYSPVSTSEWHHYVAVVGENFNTGYLDGVEMIGRRYSFGNSSYSQFFEDAVVHEKMWLGKGHWDNTTQYFNGTIDELRIYDKALTSDEVLDLFGIQSSVNQNKNNIAEIKILPNPVGEILHYDLSEINEKILFIRISNTNGKVVIKEKVLSNDDELYIGKLPEGIYFVDFIGKKNTFHEKVVISY